MFWCGEVLFYEFYGECFYGEVVGFLRWVILCGLVYDVYDIVMLEKLVGLVGLFVWGVELGVGFWYWFVMDEY